MWISKVHCTYTILWQCDKAGECGQHTRADSICSTSELQTGLNAPLHMTSMDDAYLQLSAHRQSVLEESRFTTGNVWSWFVLHISARNMNMYRCVSCPRLSSLSYSSKLLKIERNSSLNTMNVNVQETNSACSHPWIVSLESTVT